MSTIFSLLFCTLWINKRGCNAGQNHRQAADNEGVNGFAVKEVSDKEAITLAASNWGITMKKLNIPI